MDPLEREAVRVHEWSPGVVPGLLQTADYARSVIRAGAPRDSDETIEGKVNARLERQEILSGPKSPFLWVVLDEGVIRQVIGSPKVMGAQLDKLIKSADSPGVVIQVLPFAAPDHAGVEGPIAVYEPRGGAAVGYTECHRGGRVVEHPEEVADLMTTIGMLRAVALSPRDSAALTRRVRRDLDGLPEVELQRFVGRQLRRSRRRRHGLRAGQQRRRFRPGAQLWSRGVGGIHEQAQVTRQPRTLAVGLPGLSFSLYSGVSTGHRSRGHPEPVRSSCGRTWRHSRAGSRSALFRLRTLRVLSPETRES